MKQIRGLTEDEWRELIRLIRRRLPNTMYAANGAAEKLNSKRFLRRLRRRMIKTRQHRARESLQRDIMLWPQMKECEVLEGFLPDRKAKWLNPTKRKISKEIDLTNFSLLDYPKRTFILLHNIAEAEAQCRKINLNFLDEYCLDIAPYLVLGLMRQRMAPVIRGGKITGAIRSMTDAAGLNPLLHITHAEPPAALYRFWAFPVRHRRGASASDSKNIAFQPSAKEKLIDDLVDTLDEWLVRRDRASLSADQKSSVARMVSEVLDNAERHAELTKSEGDWAIAAFSAPTTFAQSDGSDPTYNMVSLATMSIGATIAESMAACEDPDTVALIDDYVAKYEQAYPRDLLTTVYALQDRISRFRQDDAHPSGGVGMLDMVEFANEMGISGVPDTVPSVTLISGRSCVMIRPPYGKAPDAPRSSRRLWFNSANSLDEAPNPNHVFTLPYRFPGTIVAVRFCIAAEDGVERNDHSD